MFVIIHALNVSVECATGVCELK